MRRGCSVRSGRENSTTKFGSVFIVQKLFVSLKLIYTHSSAKITSVFRPPPGASSEPFMLGDKTGPRRIRRSSSRHIVSDIENPKEHEESVVMRVAVTGGAGYIGSHTVVELLQAGHEVLILDSF